MRLMVFSDIHGNLAALKAVLEDAGKRNVHRSICLGDIVGYGPFPNECLELIKSVPNCRSLAGNHDVATLWETSPYGMSSAAKEAILWTMDALTEENKTYLSQLPDRLDLFDMTFVHANPYNPKGWRYVMDRKYALRSFAATKSRHIFIGHSHRPLLIIRKHFFGVDILNGTDQDVHSFEDRKRRIINCGSVGQPRDRDPRASYLIYDSRRQQYEFHRVAYEIAETIRAIHAAGLPSILAQRLKKGL